MNGLNIKKLNLKSSYIFDVRYLFMNLQKLFLFSVGSYLLKIKLAKY